MSDENILPMIGISPSARKRWNAAIERFAANSKDPRYSDSENYPAEKAVLVGEGLIALRITFDDGAELEMMFSAWDWRWLSTARS